MVLKDKGFTFTFEGNDDFYMIQKNHESKHSSFQTSYIWEKRLLKLMEAIM